VCVDVIMEGGSVASSMSSDRGSVPRPPPGFTDTDMIMWHETSSSWPRTAETSCCNVATTFCEAF